MATEREFSSVDKSALQQAVIAALEALVENARVAMLCGRMKPQPTKKTSRKTNMTLWD
ncbi:MAG: hypothetical protein R3F38_08275 [Gammaproteobacteria bacterium]